MTDREIIENSGEMVFVEMDSGKEIATLAPILSPLVQSLIEADLKLPKPQASVRIYGMGNYIKIDTCRVRFFE